MLRNFSLLLKTKGEHFDKLIKNQIRNFFTETNLKKITGMRHAPGAGLFIDKSLTVPLIDFFDRKSKKLRPIFGAWLLEALGNKSKDKECFFCLPEILHSASLIIDDIEDNATKRRNKPALHLIYGIDSAVNAANALYFLPFCVVNNSRLSTQEKVKISEILSESMQRIHLGQGMDILWHKKVDLLITPAQYIQMVKLKTSSFFRAETQLAFLFSKKKNSSEEKWNTISENLGVAFQIMDDILDLTLTIDEQHKFGKDFSQDIAEGKKTLVIIDALSKASLNDRKRLIEILKCHSHEQRLRQDVLEILNKYNSIENTRVFVTKLAQQIKKDISSSLKSCASKDLLQQYCDFMIERKY
jgi:geranylgeranyl diphosphate synthase type I